MSKCGAIQYVMQHCSVLRRRTLTLYRTPEKVPWCSVVSKYDTTVIPPVTEIFAGMFSGCRMLCLFFIISIIAVVVVVLLLLSLL